MEKYWRMSLYQLENGKIDNKESSFTNFSTGRKIEKILQSWYVLNSRQKRDEEVVCYGDLGCFRDEGPFNYLDMLPSPPEEIRTVFYLYTLKNKEIPQVLEYNNITTVSQSNFNASAPTKIIIHGFGSSCNKIWPREMRLSFLAVVRSLKCPPPPFKIPLLFAGRLQCDLCWLGCWCCRSKLRPSCGEHPACWKTGRIMSSNYFSTISDKDLIIFCLAITIFYQGK